MIRVGNPKHREDDWLVGVLKALMFSRIYCSNYEINIQIVNSRGGF